MPRRGGKKNRNNIINRKAKESVNHQPVSNAELVDQKDSAGDESAADAVGDVTASQRSSDVAEGRTIFIRNLSYNTDESEISDLMMRFGDLEYCVICRTKETGQSRGSAFVKFRDAASADACLAADASDLVIDSRNLNVDYALDRLQVQKKTGDINKKEKDKRNLYLENEGWIRAGTEAAIGVSASDLQKRAALSAKKKTLLRLLTNFVSKTRLCVHNLPPDMENKELKALFLDAGGVGAVITECRVMRNRLANGKLSGSKGFAFVNFTQHENALLALRKLNNNPDVFTNTKRPIVEFSIEDMYALKKRERRAEKSAEALKQEKGEGEDCKVRDIAKKIGVAPRLLHKTFKQNDKKKRTRGKKKTSKK